MPLFFFDPADGTHPRDVIGTVLPDISTARIHAVCYAGELLRNHPRILWDGRDFTIEVFDKNRMHLFSIIVFELTLPAGDDAVNHSVA